MGYLDTELGIKTTAGLKKHLKKLFPRMDIECIKTDAGIHFLWARDNQLHKFFLKASVIYVIQEEELDEAINAIKGTL